MSCLIPAGASIKARKIYNRLVPDVFPPTAPQSMEPISIATMRKVSKLQEYVQNAPGQIAKVSRRLSRRIMKDINQEKSGGYVKIAVAAYIALLDHSTDEGSSYSYGFFSPELVDPPVSLIPTLLGHSNTFIQGLGAELLASFIRAQDPVDNRAALLESYMAQITRLVLGERGRRGRVTLDESLKASCLLAIDEYVQFCIRVKILPAIIEDVEACIFITIDPSSKECRQILQEAAAKAGGKPFSKLSILTAPRTKMAGPSSDPPSTASEAAISALVHFRPLLQDVGVVFSIVYRILQTLLKYIDGEGKWEEAAFVQGLLGLVAFACGDQTLPLFTALLRHGCSQGLTPRQRSVIIQQAAVLGSEYPLSALSLALAELPRTLTVSSGAPTLTQETLAAVKKLANEVGDASQICEAASGALRLLHPSLPLPLSLSLSPTSADGPGSLPSYSLQGPQPLTLSTLECVHAALQTLPHIKDSLKKSFAPRSFPSSLVLQLGTLITALPASASSLKAGNISGSPERSLALKALLDVTGAAASGSGSWIDEGHGLSLLSIARDLAMHASSGPRELEGASWITASVALGIIALPSASKQGAQAAIELARLAVRTREAGLSSSNKWPITRQCAGLLLTECLLKQLAACTNSSGLLSLSSPATFKALQEGSQPGLLLITGGSTSSSTTATSTTVPTLLASSDAFVSNPETETRAKGGVDAARKAPALSISTVASALESSEVLKKDQLSSLLSEPSSDILQVTDRDCARVDLSKVVELFCDDEGEVGLNSIALTLKV